MPDAVSVLGIGRRLDVVATPAGAQLEDASGRVLDREPGEALVAAERLWRRVSAGEEPADGPPGTGLIAIGGFAFDPGHELQPPWQGFAPLLFRVPELTLTRTRGRTYAGGDLSLLSAPKAYRGVPAHRLTRTGDTAGGFERAVSRLTRRLSAGEAKKVVLARQVVAQGDGVLAAAAVVGSLRAAYPSCYSYLVPGEDGSVLVGASPELLVRRQGRIATSQPMAGSIARGADEAGDLALAGRLRDSRKDSSEHSITSAYVAERLAEVALDVSTSQVEVVKLASIQHLATTVVANLFDPAPSLLELAYRLHPTPAVNGDPKAAARALIAQLEGMERGWYAGAVGWMDARGDGELAVALRCGLLQDDRAMVYAGVGVMPDSDPAAELAESALKLRAILDALGVGEA